MGLHSFLENGHRPRQGDEWSALWGGSGFQWFGSIFPRIRHSLPVETILGIFSGYGRLVRCLKNDCKLRKAIAFWYIGVEALYRYV